MKQKFDIIRSDAEKIDLYPIFSGFRVRVRARVRKPKHVHVPTQTAKFSGFSV